MVRSRHVQAGFTMPELLVSILVMSFLVLGVTAIYLSNQRAYQRGQTQTETHQNARVGLEMLARELRMAGFDPLNQIALQTTPSVFQAATADRVTFLADVSGDDTLDRVTYRQQSGLLLREFSSWNGSAFPAPTVEVIATGLTSFGFAYADGTQPTNVPLTAPVTGTTLWDIRRITATIRIEGQTVTGQAAAYDLSIDVRPRNLV